MKSSETIDFRRHFRTLLVCFVLILATSAVYWRVTGYDFVNLDDNIYVYENRHVQNGLTSDSVIWAFTTTHHGFKIPLTWLSLMLDFELYGLDAGGYHLTNLLLHIANVLLLFLVLKRMTGTLWRSGFVAALFALHPLHVESVAWVTERKDVLSTLFWMLTMWGYLYYVERPGLKRYLLILVGFSLGLMAKPMLVTLPFVLLLLDYWPLRRFQVDQSADAPEVPIQAANKSGKPKSAALSLVWEKIPLLALVVVSSVVTILAQRSVGNVVRLETWPIKIRVANGLVSYVKYVGKMIWPHPLAVYYPHPGYSLPIWKAAVAGVLLLCISILVVRGARRYPYLGVGWFWYLGTLVPVIGFVQVGAQAMADRFTYIPLIGLYIIIAWGVPEIVPRWPHRKIYLATLSTTLLLILMALTWKQIHNWKNSISLFEHTLEVTSNNWLIHTDLGVALYRNGRTNDAIKHYQEALRIKPDYAGAHTNLGVALYRNGRTDDAIKHYQEALRIKPDYAEAHYNLGVALQMNGRANDAIKHYQEALRIKPDYLEAHINLGVALYRNGRTDDAIKHYQEALRIKPDYAGVHYNLGNAFASKGNFDMAAKHFQKALQINPNFSAARDHLKKALLLQKRNQ